MPHRPGQCFYLFFSATILAPAWRRLLGSPEAHGWAEGAMCVALTVPGPAQAVEGLLAEPWPEWGGPRPGVKAAGVTRLRCVSHLSAL